MREKSMNQQIVATLKAARSYIKRGWCQHRWAVNALDRPCLENSDQAVGWCVTGAMVAAKVAWFERQPLKGSARYERSYKIFNEAKSLLYSCNGTEGRECMPLFVWNDLPERTQEDVLDLYDRAIAKAEKGGSDA